MEQKKVSRKLDPSLWSCKLCGAHVEQTKGSGGPRLRCKPLCTDTWRRWSYTMKKLAEVVETGVPDYGTFRKLLLRELQEVVPPRKNVEGLRKAAAARKKPRLSGEELEHARYEILGSHVSFNKRIVTR